MKMSIVKAQKKIYAIKGELSDLESRLQDSITTIAGNEYKESFDALITEIHRKKKQLVDLKTAVMVANIEFGMFVKILELGENKSWINTYKALNIVEGKQTGSRWDNGVGAVYQTQLTEKSRQDNLKKIKANIEHLTDELDQFNATHYVEVDIE